MITTGFEPGEDDPAKYQSRRDGTLTYGGKMANSFTQIYIHYVFIAKSRMEYFKPEYKKKIYPYIVGIAKEHHCYIHSINGGIDHIHILLSLAADKSIAQIAQLLKGNCSKHINDEKLYPFRFEWQAGYGAFSVSQSNLDRVKQYIDNQETHHQKVKLREEYLSLLNKYLIKYDEKYLPEM